MHFKLLKISDTALWESEYLSNMKILLLVWKHVMNDQAKMSGDMCSSPHQVGILYSYLEISYALVILLYQFLDP